jgi:hypothetical protein
METGTSSMHCPANVIFHFTNVEVEGWYLVKSNSSESYFVDVRLYTSKTCFQIHSMHISHVHA